MRYFGVGGVGGGGGIAVINEHLILLILQTTWLYNGKCQGMKASEESFALII